MTGSERLAEVFARGQSMGLASLTATERDLWLVHDFIQEHDGGGLSGYFYNRLPDLATIQATVEAMQRQGLTQLAEMLNVALELYREYVDPDTPTTWREVQRRYDPLNQLDVLSNRIYALGDYGLAGSRIGKDAKDAKAKQIEAPKNAMAGTVKSVDRKKATFTITMAGKKVRSFLAEKTTQFHGPKGSNRGTGPKGLEDDCMTPGYEIRVVVGSDGKTAKDVYLPARKAGKK
jgi:hypothetical protein